MRGLTYIFLAALCCIQIVSAQTGTVKGAILDSASKEGIPFVDVTLKETKFQTKSDLNGQFVLNNIPTGSYTLCLTFVGYIKVFKLIEVKEKAITNLNLVMQPNGVDLGGGPIVSEPLPLSDVGKCEGISIRWQKCTAGDSVEIAVMVLDDTSRVASGAIITFEYEPSFRTKYYSTDKKGNCHFKLFKNNSLFTLKVSYGYRPSANSDYVYYECYVQILPDHCQTIRMALKNPVVEPLVAPKHGGPTVTREEYNKISQTSKDSTVRSSIETRELIYKNYERANKEVKAIYDSLITLLTVSKSSKAPRYKKIVVNGQKSWESYASNSCTVELKLASEAAQGGDSFYYSCYSEKAAARISELRQQYYNIKSDIE